MSEIQAPDYTKFPKVWAWDSDKEDAIVGYLMYKYPNDGGFLIISETSHQHFGYIEPYTEPEKKMRPMTHEEIFLAVWEGALIYNPDGLVFNSWDTALKFNVDYAYFKICLTAKADLESGKKLSELVFTPMEIEE